MTLAPLVDAWGWTLVHFAWQGAVVGLLLGVVLAVMPVAKVQARYLASCAALLTMIASTLATFAWQARLAGVTVAAPAAGAVTAVDVLDATAGDENTPKAALDLPTAVWPGASETATDIVAPAADEAIAERTWWQAASARLSPWIEWLTRLWAVGVVLLLTRLALNWQAVRRLRTTGQPIHEARWTEAMRRLAAALRVGETVNLLASAQARVPMVVGWLRPAILIPVEMVTGLSTAEMRAILAHELAHIRRYDYVVNLLQNLAETVLFFHPAVWWASAQIRREREYCCDHMASAACNGVVEYARALLAAETLRRGPALGMAVTGGSLVDRVRRLTGQESHEPRGAGGAMAAAGALVVAAALVGVAGTPNAGRAGGPQEEAPAGAAAPSKGALAEPIAHSRDEPLGDAASAATGKDAAEGRLSDAEAKALAVRAHQKAAALNELPQLYYEVSYRNGDVATMGEVDAYSLENLRKAFDEPVKDDKWIRVDSTLAWDPKHMLLASHSFRIKNNDGSRSDYHQTYFGDKSAGWAREESGNHLAYYRRNNIEAFWVKSFPTGFKYFALTPRKFWWGDNSGHNLGHSAVPPAKANYRFVGREEMGGELCDVVESKGRAERLWIGQEMGLVHACLEFIYQGRMNTEFYRHPVVERIAGRTFASSKEYREWHNMHGEALTPEQKGELSKVWYEEYFDEMARPSSLIVFSDYREIAPGVWLPFAEDRTTWHHSGPNEEKFKYIKCESRVTKAALDVDLEEKVESLTPRAGDRVQDQRVDGAVVEYAWRDGITEEEIASLVQGKRLESDKSRKLIEELRAPMEKLVGRAAPALPDEGWVGVRPPLAGKPYLIHFWAAWCGPCKNDYEILNRVAKNRVVVGVHPAGTPRGEVEKAIAEGKQSYPTLISEKSKEELVGGYPVKMYPYCVVVDGQGNVAAHGSLAQVAEAFGELHAD